MDYLNPQKEFRQNIMLFIGYGTIAIAVAMTTLLLVQQAYGFGLAKNGQVVQSGLVFFSSQPNPASITLNGKLSKSRTDTRLNLPEKTYQTVISRDGYRDWQRTIQVEGGKVRRYDYPLLVPKQLKPTTLARFDSAPSLSSQSLDRRWLVTQSIADSVSFSVYDLKNPTKAAETIALPDSVATKATTSQSWIPLEWADDNTHLLLQHAVDEKIEYILLNRTNPDQSINLSNTITGATYNTITLINRKYDRYYLQDTTNHTVLTASISQPAALSVLQHVLAFKSYSDDTLLYATDEKAPTGKVFIKLRVGDRTYSLQTVPANTTYLLDLTEYSNNLYVILGASSTNKLTIYKDPVGQYNDDPHHSLAPSQVLHVNQPNYVGFSTSAQYIMAENGTQFSVYDIENDKGYNYTASQPLDAPALHATWMDGNRLTYVSKGVIQIFDYDYLNQQTLGVESSFYLPIFGPDYKYVYAITSEQPALMQTSLLTPNDQ